VIAIENWIVYEREICNHYSFQKDAIITKFVVTNFFSVFPPSFEGSCEDNSSASYSNDVNFGWRTHYISSGKVFALNVIEIRHVTHLMQQTDRGLILKRYLRHNEGPRYARLVKILEYTLDHFETDWLDWNNNKESVTKGMIVRVFVFRTSEENGGENCRFEDLIREKCCAGRLRSLQCSFIILGIAIEVLIK
jgi:hypothetical protein